MMPACLDGANDLVNQYSHYLVFTECSTSFKAINSFNFQHTLMLIKNVIYNMNIINSINLFQLSIQKL